MSRFLPEQWWKCTAELVAAPVVVVELCNRVSEVGECTRFDEELVHVTTVEPARAASVRVHCDVEVWFRRVELPVSRDHLQEHPEAETRLWSRVDECVHEVRDLVVNALLDSWRRNEQGERLPAPF